MKNIILWAKPSVCEHLTFSIKLKFPLFFVWGRFVFCRAKTTHFNGGKKKMNKLEIKQEIRNIKNQLHDIISKLENIIVDEHFD